MSYQEGRTITYLISNLIVVGLYSFYVLQQQQAGNFDTNTIPSTWGSAVLIMILAQIVLSIVLSILFNIIHAIVMKEEEPSLSDERDQLIDLRANRISYAVFGVGFIISMVSLAVGMRPLVMFNLIIYALFGASIVGYITQLVLYRRGF